MSPNISPQVEACARLIRSNAAPNTVQDSLRVLTDLNELTSSGETLLHHAISSKRLDVVRNLISLGADVNAVDLSHGYTPMHYSVEQDDIGFLEELLKHRADPNKTNARGATPLQYVTVRIRPGRPDMVRPLLAAGASIDIVNDAGTTLRGHLATVTSEYIRAPFAERGLICLTP